jgi:hypothetical protein
MFVHLSSEANWRAYVWNQESLAAGVETDEFRIEPSEFRVEVVVKGSHPKARTEGTWRVWTLSTPQIVRDGDLFAVEKAIREVERAES